MSLTALDLSPDARKRYRPLDVIRRRRMRKNSELVNRRRRAMLTARQAAKLLRDNFDAAEIFVFGSLARPGDFSLWSDIDLAARGIPPSRFFEAVGDVTGISPEFKIDLVDLDTCSTTMRTNIEAEGKPL